MERFLSFFKTKKIEKTAIEECPICLEGENLEELYIDFCKNKHIFHKSCLQEWTKRNNNCPICREKVISNGRKISELEKLSIRKIRYAPSPTGRPYYSR